MNELIRFIVEPYQAYTLSQISIEIIATVLGISSVVFSMKRNIWVYPTGIISTFLYIFLYFSWGLYGETLVNLYYTIMSVYGWILWYRNTEADQIHVKVGWASKLDYLKSIVFFGFTFLFIMGTYYFRPLIENRFDFSVGYNFQHNYSIIDFTDAALAGIFFVGMWMMAKRKIDNWIFWIIGDFVMIFLLLYKGYAISSFQYLIFTILAINAFRLWKRDFKLQVSKSE